MGKHSAPSRRDLRRSTETTTEIPPVVDPTAPIPRITVTSPYPPPLRLAVPWIAAGAALVATTAAVGIAVAPHPADPVSHSVAEIIAEDAKDVEADPFDRLALVAASRAQRDADADAAAQVQEAAESVAIASRIAAEKAAEEKAAAEARAAQEAREAAAAKAAAAKADEEDEDSGEQTAPASQTSAGVIVPGARLTSGFGTRWGSPHNGIDLAAPLGTPIYTPFGGKVIKAGPSSGFGNAVIIATDEGDEILFGHMRVMTVSVGDRVNEGDLVAYVGNEGQSTGPHCHVEIHVNGTPINPVPYLQARGVKL